MSSLLQSRTPEVVGPTQIPTHHVNQIVVLAAAVVPLIAILLLVRIPAGPTVAESRLDRQCGSYCAAGVVDVCETRGREHYALGRSRSVCVRGLRGRNAQRA